MEQDQREKKNSRILPYVGFVIRILFGIFALLIATLVFLDLLTRADTRFTYGLCFLVPVISVIVIGGDLYLRYKLDIKPLRNRKEDP